MTRLLATRLYLPWHADVLLFLLNMHSCLFLMITRVVTQPLTSATSAEKPPRTTTSRAYPTQLAPKLDACATATFCLLVNTSILGTPPRELGWSVVLGGQPPASRMSFQHKCLLVLVSCICTTPRQGRVNWTPLTALHPARERQYVSI